jgi:hypothetical protein
MTLTWKLAHVVLAVQPLCPSLPSCQTHGHQTYKTLVTDGHWCMMVPAYTHDKWMMHHQLLLNNLLRWFAWLRVTTKISAKYYYIYLYPHALDAKSNFHRVAISIRWDRQTLKYWTKLKYHVSAFTCRTDCFASDMARHVKTGMVLFDPSVRPSNP